MRLTLLAAFVLALPALAGPVDDARLMYLDGDYAAALDILRPAAEAGDANAQNILGDAYDQGNGVSLDAAEAVRWWEMSAEQGFDKAQYNLGLLYEQGRDGIEPDPERAAAYYEQAMENGNPTAPTNLGFLYEQGLVGVLPGTRRLDGRGEPEPDLERAAELYQIGVDRGDAHAMNNLANFYVSASGVDEDLPLAIELFRQSAEAGHVPALSNLGVMYESGYGTAHDPMAAFALYSLGARGGHPQAAVNLAWMLHDGTAPGGEPSDKALPLAYCWWGVAMEMTADASLESSSYEDDCGALSEGLSDEEIARAGAIADGLSGG